MERTDVNSFQVKCGVLHDLTHIHRPYGVFTILHSDCAITQPQNRGAVCKRGGAQGYNSRQGHMDLSTAGDFPLSICRGIF